MAALADAGADPLHSVSMTHSDCKALAGEMRAAC
jgi:hypothetical protein